MNIFRTSCRVGGFEEPFVAAEFKENLIRILRNDQHLHQRGASAKRFLVVSKRKKDNEGRRETQAWSVAIATARHKLWQPENVLTLQSNKKGKQISSKSKNKADNNTERQRETPSDRKLTGGLWMAANTAEPKNQHKCQLTLPSYMQTEENPTRWLFTCCPGDPGAHITRQEFHRIFVTEKKQKTQAGHSQGCFRQLKWCQTSSTEIRLKKPIVWLE